MDKKLENLKALTARHTPFGSWLAFDSDCETEDKLELAEWFRQRDFPEGDLTNVRDSLVNLVTDLANETTDTLFEAVRGCISDVTGGEMWTVSEFYDLPEDSPLYDKLETACLDLKETWEGLGLTYLDLDELLGRWGYLVDGPEECYEDISAYATRLAEAEGIFPKEGTANGTFF